MNPIDNPSLLISPNARVKQAMRQLNENGERILFVTGRGKKLIGTITDGDIRRGIADGMQFGDRITKIINRKFISVEQGRPGVLEFVKKIMIDTMIEQVPIVDKARVIKGFIRWTDILGGPKNPVPKRTHHNKVVVMAGGRGSRLEPFTDILPKPLVPIGGKPAIEIIMERFSRHGFSDFIYTLNYKKEYIKLFLAERRSSYSIDWVEEAAFMGTAGGLSALKGRISDSFFVTNCDSILEVDFERVLKWHREQDSAITIIGSHSEIKIPFGVLQMSGGRLIHLKEKPVHDVIVNTGVYVMEPRVISYIPAGKRMEMNELIDRVKRKEKVSVYTVYDEWFDMGQMEEYKKNIEKLSEFRDV